MVLFIGLITFSLGLFFFIKALILYKRKESEIYERILKEKELELLKIYEDKRKEMEKNYNDALEKKANEKQRLLLEKSRILNEIAEVNATKNTLIKDKEKLIEETTESYKKIAFARVDTEAAARKAEILRQIEDDANLYRAQKSEENKDIQQKIEASLAELATVKKELDAFAAKQNAIKEAILREQEKEIRKHDLGFTKLSAK